MTTRASVVASAIHRAAQLDREWQGKLTQTPGDRARYTLYMPFNKGEFAGLLAEAVAGYEPGEDEDIRFLAIGCGPGSELLIARDVFGLDAVGFDRIAEYTAAARSLGLRADDADAEHYTAYGRFQVIWFNRVARDAKIQKRIEARVWRDTAPGTVVICANLEAPPPGWFPVLDDWEARRGIFMKPGRTSGGW